MYQKCITCDHIDGCPHSPRFYQMPPQEVLDWCRRRIKHLGITLRDVAKGSNLPEGTITRIFSENSKYTDYKHTTIQPILAFLCGNSLGEPPCPAPDQLQADFDALKEKYDRATQKLESIEAQHRADMQQAREESERKIAHLNKEIDDYREELTFKRSQLKSAHHGRVTMTAICVALLLLAVAALVIDRLNPDIGFFWLDRLKAAWSGVSHNTALL